MRQGETGVMQSQAEECWQPPAQRLEEARTSGGSAVLQYHDSGLLGS